jgi:hypothetical protein
MTGGLGGFVGVHASSQAEAFSIRSILAFPVLGKVALWKVCQAFKPIMYFFKDEDEILPLFDE